MTRPAKVSDPAPDRPRTAQVPLPELALADRLRALFTTSSPPRRRATAQRRWRGHLDIVLTAAAMLIVAAAILWSVSQIG